MQTSITNLQPKSNAMYADWISVWVISLFLYWVSRCPNLSLQVLQPCHLYILRLSTTNCTNSGCHAAASQQYLN